MDIVRDSASLKRRLANGGRIAFVPTLGGIHIGHLRLIERARQLGDTVVVSIFVNRLQFGEGEDFEDYPRDFAEDAEKISPLADVLFAPDEREIYPSPQQIGISLPPLAGELCGASRPHFFGGVAVVVAKLFNIVAPDIAIFGRKDYQQTHLIRLMARQLNFPIEIHAVETARESDGLAASSRNIYLSADERKRAPELHRALSAAAKAVDDGAVNFAELCETAAERIRRAGFIVDYVEVRDAETMGEAQKNRRIVFLAAATLGRARLIDNAETGDASLDKK